MANDDFSRRQLAKRQSRKAGDRSADLARMFMLMKDATLAKLELEEDLKDAIDRARAVTSPIARRRAERALAGDLRGFDLVELAEKVANVELTGAADSQLFHLAEQWRTRLLEEADAAAQFPGGNVDPLPKLVADAKREHDTGKPAGAKRVLFRHVLAVLRQPR